MSVRFDAVADRLLRTTNIPDYNSVYTWMAWIKVTSFPGFGTPASLFSINQNQWAASDRLYIMDLGSGYMIDCSINNNYIQGTTPLSLGTWYHVAFVRTDISHAYGYLNGVLEPTNTTDVTGRAAATRMEMGGGLTTNDNPYDGVVACVKVFSVALTIDQIKNEMVNILPVFPTSLHIWSPNFPGSPERTLDYSGNTYNWTESGTLTDENPPPVSYGATPQIPPTSLVEVIPIGTVCWGQITGVVEDNVRTFVDHWIGTGTITGSGDAEQLELSATEYMESEVIETDIHTIELLQNYYGVGDTIVLKYRHGATEGDCLVASWNAYTVPFDSLGFVQVRVESTL